MQRYSWATHSQLDPVKQLVWTIKPQLKTIITTTLHAPDNRKTKSINSRIKLVNTQSAEIGHKRHINMAAYFNARKLNLYLETPYKFLKSPNQAGEEPCLIFPVNF